MSAAASFLNTSHQTIGWFVNQNSVGHLILRPPFQRRPVWTEEEKAYLVDSIMRGYPVPEIYVYSIESDDGSGDDIYAVVDGQQRLRTCLEFMSEPGFPVTFDVHKLEPLYSLAETPWYGKRFSALSKDERDRFRRYKLIVRTLEGVSDDEIRHMFHRLNQSNVALNSQELRYSMYRGGLLEVVERLVGRGEWEHFRLFTKVQQRRMLDSEYIGELIIGYLHWPQNKKDNLDHYYRQYSAGFPFRDQVLMRFDEVLSYLEELFSRPRMSGTRWYRKSDFYTLFLAMARGSIDIGDWGLEALRTRLTEFSRAVSSADPVDEDTPIAAYRSAVERAATDRARRIRREEALVSFLTGEERSVVTVDKTASVYTEADGAVGESENQADEEEADEEYADA